MNSRNNNFALLHYVAACMVILGHMFVLVGEPVPVTINTCIHELGVNILFIISGYLVSKSFMRNSQLKNFWIKRLMRIYPPFAVCVLLCAVGGVFLSDCALREYISGAEVYVRDNLLMRPQFSLPGVFSNNSSSVAVNGSLWTLPIELACFFLLPFYLLAIKKIKWKFPVCVTAAMLMSCLGI